MAKNDLQNVRIAEVLASARAGALAQEQLERTLGQALLKRMAGQTADLSEIFRELGGTDPGIFAMFDGGMTEQFQLLPVQAGAERARDVALSQEVRNAVTGANLAAVADKGGSGSGKKVQANITPLANEQGQALHTLAGLAGVEFGQAFSG